MSQPIIDTIDAIMNAGSPAPQVQLSIHKVSNDQAIKLINATGLEFKALGYGDNEWLTATTPEFSLTLFLRKESHVLDTTPHRALQVIADAKREAQA